MEKKIINTSDNDELNPMSHLRNYGAGRESGDLAEREAKQEQENKASADEKPFPDELAFPENADEDEETTE